jgi:hypothetical protein
VTDPSNDPLDLAALRLYVADRVEPFFRRVLAERRDLVRALHVIGSAVTDDFEPDRSDINAMVVLAEMDLDLLDFLSELCRRMRRSRIRPTVMTPRYIRQWQDASPVELLDLKLVNVLVYGTDLFAGLPIDRERVRLECRHQLRRRLIELSWGYLDAATKKTELTDLLERSVIGLVPLVRGIVYARGDEPPVTAGPLFDALAELIGGAALSFKEVYWMRSHETRFPVAHVRDILKDYYRSIESLIDVVDHMPTPDEEEDL